MGVHYAHTGDAKRRRKDAKKKKVKNGWLLFRDHSVFTSLSSLCVFASSSRLCVKLFDSITELKVQDPRGIRQMRASPRLTACSNHCAVIALKVGLSRQTRMVSIAPK